MPHRSPWGLTPSLCSAQHSPAGRFLSAGHRGGPSGPLDAVYSLRELELSVQLELEASKDSPSRNNEGMCSPTWSQLGELRHSSSSA